MFFFFYIQRRSTSKDVELRKRAAYLTQAYATLSTSLEYTPLLLLLYMLRAGVKEEKRRDFLAKFLNFPLMFPRKEEQVLCTFRNTTETSPF